MPVPSQHLARPRWSRALLVIFIALFAPLAPMAHAAVSSNASLTGAYYFRHVLIVTDGGSGVSDMRTAAGTITFDGAGSFTYTAQQLVGTQAPAALNGSGTYTVKPGGATTLTNPLRAGATINARVGQGALVGASTEAGTTVFDLFLAIPVAQQTLSNATLNGAYNISSLEFPAANAANVRNARFKLTANGAGGFSESSILGAAHNLSDAILVQTITPPTYNVTGNGTGTLSIPLGTGQTETSQVIAGAKTIYVSQDGNYFLGGSLTAGSHGMVVGVKAFSGNATQSSWTGAFYNAGLRLDASSSRWSAVTAGVNVTTAGAIFGRRTRQSDGLFDAATLQTYSLAGDGAGPFTSTVGSVSVASTGTVFATSGLGEVSSSGYELSFGARMLPQSGSGVFLDPQGVLNAASYAVGYPIAPGGFVALFGTNLSSQTTVASTLPFPTQLSGVQLKVNGVAAPLYVVSPTLITFIVPYAATGSTATITVTSNNVASNSIEVPLAASAPGIFSLTSNGLGDGAVQHADYTNVDANSPAHPGEVIQIYLTGLGAVSPAQPDGTPAPLSEPLARFTGPLAVTIGGQPAEVFFAGLTPGLAGLYQLNVKVPALPAGTYSLAVQTVTGFTDMVDLRVTAP